ncbi:twin-arginine translocase TatA/TatE family subunit [Deinococcus humi]|uniref:Sec-independent protein translocase protein TatA n=1 Tax=Deinococcus humi TaxID=662880 RepID=A0A7W8JRC7_9DEIO|nr:twin-arginine translocase TatA/TatE family subunit [Deinococcus humi]MBB5361525.1 sec-independent protein translocase protein TatA [Deinococcus humi]GGO20514.1 Sec-independent protein translocase protein TatA [Deinococcus humi]
MPNIGPAELIVILLVALVVFGPRKLPELGKSLGAGLREFRKSTQSLKDELDVGVNDRGPQAAPTQTIHASVPAQPVSAAAVTPQAVVPAPGSAVEAVNLEKEKEPVQG